MLKPDFFSKTIFLDRDGIVDVLGLHIHLQPSAARSNVLCAVVDLCAGLGFDLSNPFSIHSFYAKSSAPCLPNFLLYRIVLSSELDWETAVAAANFAARLGLETTRLSLPLAFTLVRRPAGNKPCIFISTKKDWAKIKPDASCCKAICPAPSTRPRDAASTPAAPCASKYAARLNRP